MYQKNSQFLHTIGIAGHIDHGKTTLTKSLTGVDTDRLKEEKDRGISIELGFAPCVLPDGAVIGIVDVPGHERFIRQMIAGVAGIDLVLLVIAADDGIMPQTREHTDILQYLGINKGIIVLTKIDLVDEEWLAMVKEEVKDWANGTFLSGAKVITVSGKTGEGIELLRKNIAKEIASLPQRRCDLPARLPIDRAFKIKGTGSVVTGTMYQGRVREGDFLELLPGKTKVRVRRLQVHNKQVKEVFAGERVAINITGENTHCITRGMTLTAPGSFKTTDRIDIRFSMLKHAPSPLKQRTRVRLYVATSEVIGKIIFFDRNVLEPGQEVVCQLQLERAVVTKKGDPFIIRKLSPMITLGGGRVIDPYAERHRFGEETVRRLLLMSKGNIEEQLIQFLEQEEFATASEVMQKLSMSKEELQAMLRERSSEFVSFRESNFLLLSSKMERWNQQIISELTKYHENYPLRPGMNATLLKNGLFKRIPDKLWRGILDHALQNGKIQEANHLLFLTGFTPGIPLKYRHKIEQALTELRKKGWTPPSWETLMQEYAIPPELWEDLKSYLLHKGEIIQLTDDLFIVRDEWTKGVETLREKSSPNDILTPAKAKDILGVSRKYLIPFLESLDREKLTRRVEEGRVWQKREREQLDQEQSR